MAQLLQNAVYGTAMILAAAVLRRAMKDRLAPEARLALWAVCLFRLLTPAADRKKGFVRTAQGGIDHRLRRDGSLYIRRLC